jgi:hypothetical protein
VGLRYAKDVFTIRKFVVRLIIKVCHAKYEQARSISRCNVLCEVVKKFVAKSELIISVLLVYKVSIKAA